jgi:glutathione S-transferase
MAKARLTISSRNYSSWSLRGFLLTRLSGLPFEVEQLAADDPAARQELLLRSSSILVPCLIHDGLAVWDTLAIAEYLNELRPDAQMLPRERAARARCRSIAGEMHSGFSALRSSLPMNIRSRRPGFHVWSSAQADIDRILVIWRECLGSWGGPWLFGETPTIADAMYAPVASRFETYDVALDPLCNTYKRRLLAWPDMVEWTEAAQREPDEVVELEVEF